MFVSFLEPESHPRKNMLDNSGCWLRYKGKSFPELSRSGFSTPTSSTTNMTGTPPLPIFERFCQLPSKIRSMIFEYMIQH